MMQRGRYRIIVGALLCAALLLSSCATVNMDASMVRVPVMMNVQDIPPPRSVTHFEKEQKVPFLFLHRLFGGAKPDLSAMLQEQLQATPGDAIVNLRIHGDTNIGDLLLPVAVGTVGLFVFPPMVLFVYEPLFFDLKTYTVEGDVVTFKDAPLLPVPAPAVAPAIDPMTGLPVAPGEKKKVDFDPETGLPKR